MIWRCRAHTFDLARGPLVMGVVNVTPDSFSDGGHFAEPAAAIAHAQELIAEGADLIDVGGESTRPGAVPVAASEQLRRLLPVLAGLGNACVSVDTASAEVAGHAITAGAAVVNDVTGLGDPDMAGVVARHGAGLVIMHLAGTPATMQTNPRYDDVVRDVREHLRGRLERARSAGIAAECVAIDPGIGFGKTAAHNLELLAHLDQLADLGRPVLVGVSRKAFLGRAHDLPVDRRLEAGLAAAAVAVFLGAAIVRTHDVAATRRAIRIAADIRAAGGVRRNP